MRVYFSNLDFLNLLKQCENKEGVYLVDDLYHCYLNNKYNDFEKLIENPKLFYDVIETMCDYYNVASFHYEDDFYLKVKEDIFNNENEIRLFSSEGDNIDLFVKKEHVKGNINNKLRKILINNNNYYYLDVKSFKTIEEFDEAFLQIVKDFDVVTVIINSKQQLQNQKEKLESDMKIIKDNFED